MKTDKKTATDCLLLHPHAFFRYASGHHHEFIQFKAPDWISFYTSIACVEAELHEVKELLCNNLFEQVSCVELQAAKQLLINLKRAVFNERDLTDLAAAKAAKLPIDFALTDQYLKLKEQRQMLLVNWGKYYEDELNKHRHHLQRLVSDEVFQKGIRLSSKDLYDQLSAYTKEASTSANAKHHKMAFSLLKYLTRMYFKTSPFSTFTHIGLAHVCTEPLTLPHSYSIDSKVRLNNQILSHLQNLLASHPQLNNEIYIGFNPTLTSTPEQLGFLINFHNVESFQTIGCSPLLLRLLEIRDESKGSLRLKHLIERLRLEIDASPEEIKNYLLSLVEIGFLEFDFKVSAMSSNWDVLFIDQLKTYPASPLLTKVINCLTLLIAHRNAYEFADSTKRNHLLEEMLKNCNELFDEFLEPLGLKGIDRKAYQREYRKNLDTQSFKRHPFLLSTLTTENIIYEDSYTKRVATIAHEPLRQIVEKIAELGSFLAPVNPQDHHTQQISSFFKTHYQVSQQVPLLEFYRAYQTAEQQPTLPAAQTHEVSDATKNDTFTIAYRNLINILKESWQDLSWADTDEIHLRKYHFQSINSVVKQAQPGKPRAMFAQLYQEDEKLKAVVNHVFLGMGRAPGRFLHLFDQQITAKQQEINDSFADGKLLMELSDGSFFNANLHPPLLPFELKIPNGYTALPIEKQIQAKDILVCFDHVTQSTYLRDQQTGLPVMPYDLCLQSLSQRSKLYQLLAKFSIDAMIDFNPIIRAIKEIRYGMADTWQQKDIYVMPRLVYEDQVILKRKNWTVRTKAFPSPKDHQGGEDYFLTVNRWRIANAIPAQVFLYIKIGGGDISADHSDDYKPQYLCFETPLLVLLLGKLLKKAGEYIYLEELLPHTEQLEGHPINEALIQWYER